MTRRWATCTAAAALFILLLTSASANRISWSTPSKDMSGQVVAASADTYVAYDESSHTWEIGSSGIRRQMRYDVLNGYRPVALSNPRTGRNWIESSSTTTTDLRLVLDGTLMTGADRAFSLQGYHTAIHPDGTLELQVSLRRGPLIAYIHYVLFPWTGVIEQWVAVENTGNAVLPRLTALDSISLSLRPSQEPLILYWVQGLAPRIESPAPSEPLPVLRLRSLELTEGVSQELGSSARSSEDSMGWFALAAPGLGEGLFGGMEWSGAWILTAHRAAAQTVLQAGMQEIRRDLAPGDIFESPRRFLGFYQGDLDAAANLSHAFARTYLLRPAPPDFPWTQYNTWYAFGVDLDEETLKSQVDAAAELGLEVFTLDAGWYEGSPRVGDFGWGLGTWRANPEKFPNGLVSFSGYVHSKGLKFGLWVEPERVDLRYVGVDQEVKSEWLSPEAETRELATDEAPTVQVCLGNPAAREWIQTWLARLIREQHVDWLKWDNNLWMSCDPPGVLGDGNYAHIQGLYAVLDYLRAQFPDLIVENCASGGNRMDYALMRRTDIAWLSDETEPSYRVRYHMAGASYPFPPEYLNTWLIDSPTEPLTETTDPAVLRTWLRSRMMGAFGISADLRTWSPELRSLIASEIEQFKTTRQMVANSQLYRLLPQTDLRISDASTGSTVEPPASPDAAEFVSPGGETGTVFLFHGAIPWSQRRVNLIGLIPDTVYDVTSADQGVSLRRSGLQLATQGIRFRYDVAHPSTLLFFQPAAPDAPAEPTPIETQP